MRAVNAVLHRLLNPSLADSDNAAYRLHEASVDTCKRVKARVMRLAGTQLDDVLSQVLIESAASAATTRTPISTSTPSSTKCDPTNRRLPAASLPARGGGGLGREPLPDLAAAEGRRQEAPAPV